MHFPRCEQETLGDGLQSTRSATGEGWFERESEFTDLPPTLKRNGVSITDVTGVEWLSGCERLRGEVSLVKGALRRNRRKWRDRIRKCPPREIEKASETLERSPEFHSLLLVRRMQGKPLVSSRGLMRHGKDNASNATSSDKGAQQVLAEKDDDEAACFVYEPPVIRRLQF